jgi:hypothetical protein
MPPGQIGGSTARSGEQRAQAREGTDDRVAADVGVKHAAERAEQEGDLLLGGPWLVGRPPGAGSSVIPT